MLRRGTGRTGVVAAAILGCGLLAAGTAMAQQRPAPPAPPPAPPAAPPAQAPAADQGGAGGPERTSALFGDWAVQCVARPAGQGEGKICEMSQTLQDQQRQQVVAVLAVGRVARDQPVKFVARVPVNVQVSNPGRLVLDGPANAANEPLTLSFRSCSPLGCFAEVELNDATLRRLRARPAEQGGRVTWREANGAEAAIPISFRGFSAAFDALVREGG